MINFFITYFIIRHDIAMKCSNFLHVPAMFPVVKIVSTR